jgi:hypothetical protein
MNLASHRWNDAGAYGSGQSRHVAWTSWTANVINPEQIGQTGPGQVW